MRRFSPHPPLGLSRLRRSWTGIIAACVPAGVVLTIVAVACSKDGSTGPGLCSGTCIAISNQSDLTVNEVYFRACTDANWGANRLSGTVILPDDDREWSVDAGCWDILARAASGDGLCSRLQNDVEVASGERHLTVFGNCTTARARMSMPFS